jgi:hypothetical protein
MLWRVAMRQQADLAIAGLTLCQPFPTHPRTTDVVRPARLVWFVPQTRHGQRNFCKASPVGLRWPGHKKEPRNPVDASPPPTLENAPCTHPPKLAFRKMPSGSGTNLHWDLKCVSGQSRHSEGAPTTSGLPPKSRRRQTALAHPKSANIRHRRYRRSRRGQAPAFPAPGPFSLRSKGRSPSPVPYCWLRLSGVTPGWRFPAIILF